MGCGFVGSSMRSASIHEKQKVVFRLGNPNPENFDITRIELIGDYMVVKVNYPDCTNYEGNKIMVYKDITVKELSSAKILDPHFFEGNGVKSPIARFEPTEEGWQMATFFCRHYTGKTY